MPDDSLIDKLMAFYSAPRMQGMPDICQKPADNAPLGETIKSFGSASLPSQPPNAIGKAMSYIPDDVALAMNFLGPKVPFPARISNPIRAYHGSPHDFDKFDLSKIGTGEGAQAYGHGLYFAEAEPVARSYRTALSEAGPQKSASEWLARMKGDADFAAKTMREIAAGISDPTHHRSLTEGAALLESGKFQPSGKMYEVALHAPPESFLDWDKPLSGQSPQVAKAVETLALPPNTIRNPQAMRERAARARADGDVAHAERLERLAAEHESEMARTGQEAYNVLRGLNRGDHAGIASSLNEAGIPGIKYLDQGSRGAGQGTSNYVVWSPEIIEILRKYGIALPAAAGAIGAAMGSNDPQQ